MRSRFGAAMWRTALAGMRFRTVLILATLLASACSHAVPWRDETPDRELNLAFTLEDNLVTLTSVRVDGRPGRTILGSAAPRSVVDARFTGGAGPPAAVRVSFGERGSVRVAPAALDLGGVADAILGADAWPAGVLTVDYHAGLATWQQGGIRSGSMHLYRYPSEPAIEVEVDGRTLSAVVDTTSPDTLVLPAGQPGRAEVPVRIAGIDFGRVDVRYAGVQRARIGNRLLSRFLVSIDYQRRVIGLWRDPRIPLRADPPRTPAPASL